MRLRRFVLFQLLVLVDVGWKQAFVVPMMLTRHASSVQFLGAVPKNRSDLLPLYARFTSTLNAYMPDIGKGLIEIVRIWVVYLSDLFFTRIRDVWTYNMTDKLTPSKYPLICHSLLLILFPQLDEEFRYLQRKKLVKELAEVRSKVRSSASSYQYPCSMLTYPSLSLPFPRRISGTTLNLPSSKSLSLIRFSTCTKFSSMTSRTLMWNVRLCSWRGAVDSCSGVKILERG